MNKNQLISKIAEGAGLSDAEARRVLEVIVKSITESLGKGENVSLPGFGTFQIKERGSRIGRNPATGKPIFISAGKIPSFKASTKLKGKVGDGGHG